MAEPRAIRPGWRHRVKDLSAFDLEIIADPVEAAKAAGLQHVTDSGPGIRRKRVGKHFSYVDPDGATVRDERTLRRIKSLAIPPAWTDVWISANPRGHIQATGRDARGRKQYRYHPRWAEVRDETKYHRMILFAETLPRIRERVQADLDLPGMPREKVLATIVRLLESTLIRVGNEEYARENRSYGLTTMRNRHVEVEGSTVVFHFRGKSGVKHVVDVKDRKLASHIRRMRDLPGQHLFQYLDEDGELQTVESDNVNDYLREISGEDFTAKDFRTWAGTVLAATALEERESFDGEAQAKKNVVRAIESVSQRLGNTPSVCRKCYVHPAVIDSYMDGTTIHTLRERIEREPVENLEGLEPEEAAVLALLREQLAREEQLQAKAG